jgi:hypothetical protein
MHEAIQDIVKSMTDLKNYLFWFQSNVFELKSAVRLILKSEAVLQAVSCPEVLLTGMLPFT